jgi:hypothetical protein
MNQVVGTIIISLPYFAGSLDICAITASLPMGKEPADLHYIAEEHGKICSRTGWPFSCSFIT